MMDFLSSSNSNMHTLEGDTRKVEEDGNNNSSVSVTSPSDDYRYFEPLVGLKDTFQRVGWIFRKRFISIVGPSTIAVSVWYVAAIGIRYVMTQWSLQSQEYRTVEISGVGYGYQWETLKVTISRVGLSLELLLVFLLFCPADATNFITIANLYTNTNNRNGGGGGEQTTTCCSRASSTCIPCTTLRNFQSLFFKTPTNGGDGGSRIVMVDVLVACFLWCIALILPMALLIWIMAPEAPTYQEGFEWLYLPYWPKLIGGSLYLIYSTIFILSTYFIYPIMLFEQQSKCNNETNKNNDCVTRVMNAFQQSYRVMKVNWKHVTLILVVWFLIKFIITKIVMGLNMMYYLHDYRFNQVWSLLGIPLHPIRILYSNIDLWEFGRSWISVPFVIFIAAIGSIFKAVLYFDARVKQQHDGSYGVGMLQQELQQVVGSPDGGIEATAYTNMTEEENKKQPEAEMV